jgi:hypothetical protein
MKRLIALVLTAFTFTLLTTTASAAFRSWRVQISEPTAETSSRTLRINYNVFSTVGTDKFTVNLLEDDVLKATQTVDTPNGDSGVFVINVPATGTYTYRVDAANDVSTGTTADDEQKQSDEVTVNVVNEPEPTVTVVTVDGEDEGADGGVQAAAADGAGGAGAGQQDDGQVAGEEAATDEQVPAETLANEDEGDVLGVEDAGNNSTGSKLRNAVLAAALLAAIVMGANGYKLRRLSDE